jgi:putative aldouronate transport system substrate-binding protein
MKSKLLTVLLIACLIISLAACADSSSSDNESEKDPVTNSENWDPFSPYEEQVTFTLGRQGVAGNNLPEGDTLEDNDYLSYVEKKLNIKIDYEFSVEDAEGYKQKVNLAIASDQIPDVMIVNESQFKQLAESDMLADLTEAYEKSASPLIKDYYESFDGRVLERTTIDGKLMALPDTVIAGTHQLLWVRKDWLEKLGLDTPSTIEELKEVTKAFVEEDPDGNGKDDTVGLLGDPTVTLDGGFFTFDPVFAAYHSFPKYWIKDQSGEVTYGSITPETKDALAELREMYANGIIDKEFVTRKWNDNAALVASGKAGITFAPWYAGWMLSDSVKNNPNADWVPLTAPLDSKGLRNLALSVPSGQYLVVKKGYKHPEAVVKALSVQYEGLRLKDPDAEELYNGLGVSWLNWPLNLQLNYEDNVSRSYISLKKAVEANNPSSLPPDQVPTYDSIVKDIENPKQDIAAHANTLAFYIGGSEVGSEKLNKIEPVFYGTTKTMTSRWTNLDKLENETFLKIITGAEPLDSFDDFVSEWKKLGGDKIIEEIQEEISK